MHELYFIGMDIIEEVKTMVNFTTETCTDGMTDAELKAYEMGIKNTLAALKAMLEDNDLPVVNMKDMEIPTELSIDELEEYYCEF